MNKGLVQSFDARNYNWLPIAGRILDVDIFDFNELAIETSLQNARDITPCGLFTRIPDTNGENVSFKIVARIGSESADAEVYQITVSHLDAVMGVAAKLLMNNSPNANQKNQNEIDIAKMASYHVKTGVTNRFPRVYGDYKCPELILSPDSKLLESCKALNLRNQLLKLGVKQSEVKRFLAQNKSRSVLDARELIENAKNQFTEVSHAIGSCGKSSGRILLSELAWGDFGQFLGKCADSGNCNSPKNYILLHFLVKEVLLGIKDLQKLLSVVHGDLHLGNVLIRLVKDQTQIFVQSLIHDFGRSSRLDIFQPDDYTTDFFKFMDALTSNLHVPSNIKNDLHQLIRWGRSLQGSPTFIDQAVEFWDQLKPQNKQEEVIIDLDLFEHLSGSSSSGSSGSE